MFIEMTEELPKPEPPMPEIPPIPNAMMDEDETDEVPPQQSQPPPRDIPPTWEHEDVRHGHASRRRDSATGGRRSEHSSRSGFVLSVGAGVLLKYLNGRKSSDADMLEHFRLRYV